MANSFRLMQRFWLDLEKPDEYALAETIQILKDERSFSRAIRQGLRLWVSLRQRDTSVLIEMFPWIKEAIDITPSSKSGGNDSGGHDDRIKALQAKIDMLTDAVMQNSLSDGLVNKSKPTQLTSGIGVANRDLNKLSDDLLEVKKVQSDARNNSSYNFMIASAEQVYGNYDALPPEVIAYGVETRRIPANSVPAKMKITKAANPKAMDVPQFSAPDFDDLDMQF